MTFAKALPNVAVKPQLVPMVGGLDVVSTPAFAKPGMLAFAINYEPHFDGGYERIGGIDRYSGQPRPSDATYLVLAPTTTFTGTFAVGETLNGQTSGATGVVIQILPAYIVLTKVVGTFTRLENIRKVTTVLGVYASTDPVIDAFIDNELAALAAVQYRLDIAAVPGSGDIRGVEVLGGIVYAWRDNVGGTALAIHKSSPAGWVAVPLYQEVSFDTGTSAYVDGETLTQGANSATVKRVVLESGTWAGGTAKGRLIITAPTPGALTVAPAAGDGACALTTVNTAITLATSGVTPPRVVTRVYNFTGAAAGFRIYGCDGMNREFEFDGDVLVPINTTMPTRASHAFCHKQHLFFSYGGSLQHCSVGFPYVWSAIVGASELGIGDTITGMAQVGGSETSSALMIFASNRVSVLYGNGSASWQLSPISDEAGGTAHSIQTVGKPLAHDAPGFRSWSPTQDYGNFVWELASSKVEPLVKNKAVNCSAVVRSKGRYRCFFSDGTAITGLPRGDLIEWTPIDYGRDIVVACQGEIAGASRVFYGDSLGFIYEADVGRSFDGDAISAAIKPIGLTQGSTITNKQYRRMDAEILAEGAFTLLFGFEFNDGDPEAEPTASVSTTAARYAGQALIWDGSNWDQAYWDGAGLSRKRLPSVGQGYSISPLMSVNSANELPHKINALTVVYTPLRMLR